MRRIRLGALAGLVLAAGVAWLLAAGAPEDVTSPSPTAAERAGAADASGLALQGRTRPPAAQRRTEMPQSSRPTRATPWGHDPETVEVRFRLRLPDGTEPSQATIWERLPTTRSGSLTITRGVGRRWTPEAPTVHLRRGARTIEVRAGQGREWESDPMTLEVGPASADVDVLLRVRPHVRGRVIAAPGDALTEVVVCLQPAAAAQESEDPWEDPEAEFTEVSLSHTDGSFSFGLREDLAPGTYVLSAAAWKHGPWRASRTVTLESAPIFVEIHLPPIDRREGVFLRVLDPQGATILPDEVGVNGAEGSFHPAGGGTVWVPTVLGCFGREQPSQKWIDVRVHRYGVRDAAVPAPAASSPIDVQFVAPAQIGLRVDGLEVFGSASGGDVLDEYDVEIAGGVTWPPEVLVHARRGDFRIPVAWTRLDEEGATSLRLQPGAYSLALHAIHPIGRWTVPLGTLLAMPGEQEVTRDVPPLFPVRIHGASDSLRIHGAADGPDDVAWRGPATTVLDLVPGLPAGDYEARSERRSARFRLPGTTEVTLVEGGR